MIHSLLGLEACEYSSLPLKRKGSDKRHSSGTGEWNDPPPHHSRAHGPGSSDSTTSTPIFLLLIQTGRYSPAVSLGKATFWDDPGLVCHLCFPEGRRQPDDTGLQQAFLPHCPLSGVCPLALTVVLGFLCLGEPRHTYEAATECVETQRQLPPYLVYKMLSSPP